MESPDRKVRLIFIRNKKAEDETKPRFDAFTGSLHLYNPLAKTPMEEFSSPGTGVYFYADPMAPRRKRQNIRRSSNSCTCHGRGRNSRLQVSAREMPDLYYQESMVEDPWRSLKPMDKERAAALPKETSSDYNIPEGYLKLEDRSECGLSYPAALAVAYDQAFGLGESYDEPLCSSSK